MILKAYETAWTAFRVYECMKHVKCNSERMFRRDIAIYNVSFYSLSLVLFPRDNVTFHSELQKHNSSFLSVASCGFPDKKNLLHKFHNFPSPSDKALNKTCKCSTLRNEEFPLEVFHSMQGFVDGWIKLSRWKSSQHVSFTHLLPAAFYIIDSLRFYGFLFPREMFTLQEDKDINHICVSCSHAIKSCRRFRDNSEFNTSTNEHWSFQEICFLICLKASVGALHALSCLVVQIMNVIMIDYLHCVPIYKYATMMSAELSISITTYWLIGHQTHVKFNIY